MNVGIIGGGAWGCALATLVAGAGHLARIGTRGARPKGFASTPNLDALARESDLLIMAVPSDSAAEAVDAVRPDAGSMVLFAGRGMNTRDGGWMSDYLVAQTPCRRVGALAGPALASEIVAGRPTALLVASPYDEVCRVAQAALHSEHCRLYTSSDLRGVELSGAMVRALAVAVGIADGLDYGIGARGVIITRGIAEATRLGTAIGADPKTFSGLAGIGDLVSCATSPQHPSHVAGVSLARGGTISSRLIAEMRALVTLGASEGVDLPLTNAALAIATGEDRPRRVFDGLMRRAARPE